MAANVGRNIALTWGGAVIPGVREKSFQLNGDAVDVTGDDDLGWKTVLEVPGVNEVQITVAGVTKTDFLRADWFNGDRTKPVVVTFPDGGSISGTFYLMSYKDAGPYKDAITFDATLISTGQVLYASA